MVDEYDDSEEETPSKDDDELLERALEVFAYAQECEQDNRDRALADIEFARLSQQWPAKVEAERGREGRPCLTVNKLPTYIRQVVNDARQNKPAIRVSGVDSQADPQTADILTGLIRNIEYSSKADIAYDTAVENAVSSGFGYIRVNLDYSYDDTFDMDIRIERVANQFSIYGDPHSTEADSSDWNQAFVINLMPLKEFKKKYKSAKKSNFNSDAYDRLKAPWKDGEKVQVAEYWVREEVEHTILLLSDGTVIAEDVFEPIADLFPDVTVEDQRTVKSYEVKQYLMTGYEILEKNDWPGKFIPIIPVYGEEINLQGVRHLKSMIHDAKDPQRMFNYWRTTSTELVALAPKAPYIGKRGSFATDAHKWAQANVKSYPYLEYDGDIPPQRQPFSGVPAGALQEALNASDDIKATMGMFDASMGAQSNETSGRAILARQRESDTGTFHFIDNLSRAIRHTGNIILDLIPHVYTGKRVVRVLGEDGKESKEVPLNQPVIIEGTEKIFDLSLGKYDIAVSAGPSFTTKREESAAQMMELLRVDPSAAPIIRDLLASNLDWPGAADIAKRFKAMLPPQVQDGQNQEALAIKQQAEQAIQQITQQAQQLQAQLEQVKQDKQLDARKVEIDAYNAETNRLKATTSLGMTAEQVQALVLQTLQQVMTSPDISPAQQQQAMQQQAMQQQQAAQMQQAPQTQPNEGI